MNHCLSTHLFANHRLTTVWLEKTWQAGIPCVEIFCTRQHLDWRDRTQVRDVAAWFRDSELKVHSVHSPLYTDDVWGRSGPNAVLTITEPDKAKRINMVGEIKRALELAESIPFRYLIQHVGVDYEEYDERKVEAAFGALEEISLFARQRGVEVLLENIPNDLSSAERLQLFLQSTHLKLGYCFDVGHAHMGEGVERAFSLMKELIRSTHVHDNNGSDDRHLFPLTAAGGTVDWKKTMELLRSRQDQYPLLLELREVPEMPHPVEEASRVFEELEKL